MVDVDQQIRNLTGPPPPNRPPDVSGSGRTGRWPVVALVVAAGIMLMVTVLPDDSSLRARGGAAESITAVDLRLLMESGSELQRLRHGQGYAPGQRVFFSVSRSTIGSVSLWVSGPEGVSTVAELSVGPHHEHVRSESGAVAYEFEQSGTYTFYASTGEAGDCDVAYCDTVIVEVH